jgi:hypothetical protein
MRSHVFFALISLLCISVHAEECKILTCCQLVCILIVIYLVLVKIMPQSGFPSGTCIACFIAINYLTGFAVLEESGTWKEYASSLKVPYALWGIKAVGDNIIAFGNMFYSSETIIGCALRFNTMSQTFTSGSL